MEKTINKVELNGFIGMEPSILTFGNGGRKANFTLATHENYKNKEGEWAQETTWHRIVLWNKQAEKAEGQIKKGDRISITGRLCNRSFTDKNGQKRYITEVVATLFDTSESPEVFNKN